ncbi:anthranilate synthase component I family protein [PVC group bacterium]|nr:anthranilate synthase component I family protein [PVC group bacterium]
MNSPSPSNIPVLPPDAKLLPYLQVSPADLASSWPQSVPIIALICNESESSWSRWSIIAPATGRRLIVRDQEDFDLFCTELNQLTHASLLPGWVGYLGYELGNFFEPIVNFSMGGENDMPLADLIWCDKALVYDGTTKSWWSIGGLEPPSCNKENGTVLCDTFVDCTGDSAFCKSVEATKQYIYKGDIFQANITRRFSADISGDIRSAAINTLSFPGGWFGAWLEFEGANSSHVLSLSPELFLAFDGSTREVVTRPMKGTRPSGDAPEDLIDSKKDAAELHMIVDLMRNDLGRVCEFGSLQVTESRRIELHPTVWQSVGEVRGKLSQSNSIIDLLAATFPAGSITGAPKIRAMEIINELEASTRGAYCGAIGIIGGSMMLNVAIRIATFHGSGDTCHFSGSLHYGTGCGIVADSVPIEECAESHVKTDIIRSSPLFT